MTDPRDAAPAPASGDPEPGDPADHDTAAGGSGSAPRSDHAPPLPGAGARSQADGEAGEPADAGAGPRTASSRILRRSREDRVIAGVCGGIGQYVGVDPVLVRLAFVALALAGGAGLLVYVVAWLVMPQQRAGEELGRAPRDSAATLQVAAGVVLVGVGASMLLDRLVPAAGRFVWPLVLVGLGLLLLGAGLRR